MKPISKLIGLALCMATVGLCSCENGGNTVPQPNKTPYKAVIADKTMQEIQNRDLAVKEGQFWYYFRLRPLRDDGAIKFEYTIVKVGRYEAEHYKIGDTIQIVE